MINLKTLSPEIVKINDSNNSSEHIIKIMLTIGKTVFFPDKNSEYCVRFLKEAGFEPCSKKIRYFYKIIDQKIFILELNKNWVDGKIWLPLNSRNLNVCNTGIDGSISDLLGRDYEYVESNSFKPFSESFRNRRAIRCPDIDYRIKLSNGQIYNIHQTSINNFSVSPTYWEPHWPFILKHMELKKNVLIGGLIWKNNNNVYGVENNLELFERPEFKFTLDNFYCYWDSFTKKEIKEFRKLLK